MKAIISKSKGQTVQSRPPIVTVLGHVDHGKTTLLDAIRQSDVTAHEAGGITQKIGASTVLTKGKKEITFIDTPGHAAFAKMRSQGAKVADIALLIVAGEDGVKPQTLESLQLIKETNIPYIVVVTKIDLPSADVEGVSQQLEKEGVLFEGKGGNTPLVAVSGKTKKGLDELLEIVSLLWEVRETSAGGDSALEAVVIETSKDVRGPLVSVVVRNGSLKVGEVVSVQGMTAKIKNLFSDRGEAIKEALPGHGVLILGFGELPPVGAQLVHSNEPVKPSVSLKKTSKIEKLTKEQIPIILKAQNTGALDAVLASLPGGIVALEAGVGEINESDILLAKSFVVRMVLGFESKANHSVKKLAEAEGVKIETYDIIYELIQRLEEIVKKGKIDIIGKAEIVKIFPFNQKKVAGCKVVEGKISKTDSLILLRADKQLGKVRAVSLRKGKQEIIEAKAGEELGILFDPQLDFEKGDMLVSVAK